MKRGTRLSLWFIAVLTICFNVEVLHAESPTPYVNPQLWSLIIAPLLSGFIAIVAAFIAIRFDARKNANQELIKKRILIYDNVVPKLNDLLCFFLSRGLWKSLTPPLMIKNKRELDQTIYVYGPLFAQNVFDQYNIFIHTCFKTFTGVGRDACLRANHKRLQYEWGEDWKSEWDAHFVAPADVAKSQDIVREYNKLISLLAAEIGARQHSIHAKNKKNRWWNRIINRS